MLAAGLIRLCGLLEIHDRNAVLAFALALKQATVGFGKHFSASTPPAEVPIARTSRFAMRLSGPAARRGNGQNIE